MCYPIIVIKMCYPITLHKYIYILSPERKIFYIYTIYVGLFRQELSYFYFLPRALSKVVAIYI